MKLTLEYNGTEFQIKNKGRLIAASQDETEANRMFALLLEQVVDTHSCPACQDGPEIGIIQSEHKTSMIDAITSYRRMYIDEPRTR